MELTLIKKQDYKLEPYGKFALKFKTRQGYLPNIIPVDELHMKHDTSMPMTAEQDKEVIKLMKKSKTDILTDGSSFFTRSQVGEHKVLLEVWHKKLSQYKTETAFKQAVDLGHTWGKIVAQTSPFK